jgi:HlyD family secretion protein
MEQARRDFERNKELYEARLLSAQEYEASRQLYDSAIKDHELAMNSIERSQKDLALAQERLQKTRIQAPFDCTVLTRPVSVGQAVSGSGGFNSGTEVLTIADLSSMVINAHVNQADVTHLKQGAEVAVEVDAVPGLVIRGEVERIAPQATVHNNLKGYATRIALKDLDPRVQPGMTATISIPVATAQDVLVAPLSAVFSELGERYVYVRRNGQFVRQPVTVGVSDFFHAELKSGVSEGEEVALVEPLEAVESRRQENARTSGQAARPRGPAVSAGGSAPTTRPTTQGTSGARPATTSTTSGTQTTGTRSGT